MMKNLNSQIGIWIVVITPFLLGWLSTERYITDDGMALGSLGVFVGWVGGFYDRGTL